MDINNLTKMAKRIAHRTTSEIITLRTQLHLLERAKIVSNKIKLNSPLNCSFHRKNIFFISGGIVRILGMQPPSSVNPESKIQVNKEKSSPVSHHPESTNQKKKHATHQVTNSKRSTISNCKKVRSKKLRIIPSITANEIHLQTIRCEIKRMQKQFIQYAQKKMATSKLNKYIIQNWN